MKSARSPGVRPPTRQRLPGPITLFARDRVAARAAALRFFRRLQQCSDDAEACHALGAALMSLGDPSGACAAFRTALRADGAHAQSRRALGNLLFDSGQWDHALRCFGFPAPPNPP